MRKLFLLSLITLWSIGSFGQQINFDIQGHRGARGLFSENTIYGFQQTLKLGVTTLELDVVITKDNKVIVSHEPWMKASTCNGITSNKDFIIYKMKSDEVQSFDCGSKHLKSFPQQQNKAASKPLLSEVFDSVDAFAQAHQLVLPFYKIEIKSSKKGDNTYHPSPEKFMQLVDEVIRAYNIEIRVIVQSFDMRVLQELKKINPKIPLALLAVNVNGIKKNIRKLGFTPIAYSPLYLLTNRQTVKKAHAMNIQVIPWTVNKVSSMKRLIKIGCDGIITDYPNVAMEIISELNKH